MTYTDVNIVQQLTERQQGKEYIDALLGKGPYFCVPRQNGKTNSWLRHEFRRVYGPVWGEVLWRDHWNSWYGA